MSARLLSRALRLSFQSPCPLSARFARIRHAPGPQQWLWALRLACGLLGGEKPDTGRGTGRGAPLQLRIPRDCLSELNAEAGGQERRF